MEGETGIDWSPFFLGKLVYRHKFKMRLKKSTLQIINFNFV